MSSRAEVLERRAPAAQSRQQTFLYGGEVSGVQIPHAHNHATSAGSTESFFAAEPDRSQLAPTRPRLTPQGTPSVHKTPVTDGSAIANFVTGQTGPQPEMRFRRGRGTDNRSRGASNGSDGVTVSRRGEEPVAAAGGGRGSGRGKDRVARDPFPEEPRPNRKQPGEEGKDSPVSAQSGESVFDENEKEIVDNAVETVLEHGDVFDQLSHFRRLRFFGGATSMVDVAASVVYPMLIVSADKLSYIPGEVGLTTAAAAAAFALFPAARGRERRHAREILDEQQALSNVVGTPVELTRAKTGIRREKDLGLRWYGAESESPPPAQVRGYLTRIAGVAQQAQLERVVLPYDQVAPYLPQEEDFGTRMNQTGFMLGEKNRELKDKKHGNDELLMVTPEELSRIIENIEVPSDNEALDTIMHTLQKVKPEHPAHMWYSQLSRDPDASRHRLLTTFQRAVDRHHEDMTRKIVDTILVRKNVPAAVNAPEGGKLREDIDVVKIYAPVYLTGTTTVGDNGEASIRWRRSDGWHDQFLTRLFDSFHFTLPEIRDMVLHPEQYPPNRVVEASEIAAWLTLKQIDIGLGDEGSLGHKATKDTEAEDVSIRGTLQQRTYDRELGERRGLVFRKKSKNGISVTRTSVGRRAMRGVPALLVAGGIGVALGFGMNAVENHDIHRADQILNQIAVHDGFRSWDQDTKAGPQTVDRAFAKADSEDPAYRFFVGPASDFYQWLFDTTQSIENSSLVSTGLAYTPQEIKNITSQGTQHKDCPTCDAQTGNVADVPNAPVWYLKSFGGMSTDGHWAQTIYDTLGFQGMEWRNPSSIVGNGWEKAVTEAQPIQSPDTAKMSGKRIRVEQNVSFFGYSENYDAPYYIADNNLVLPLPVLEGTHITAAAVENAGPVRLATFPDGTQGLVLPKDMNGVSKVEFWLEPGEPQHLRAQVPIEPDGYVKPKGIDALWEHRLGKPLSADPEERLKQEINFISNTFLYDLAPLKNENVINDRYQFAKAVLSGDKANCNVAAGLLAISNPHLLNIVTGYLNEDSSANGYLSGNEAHEWDITPDGQMIDATPSRMTPAEAKIVAKFLSENFGGKELSNPAQQRQSESLQALEILGEWMIGAGIIWQRQRLLRGINKAGAWEAGRRMDRKTTESLQQVYDALNFALYSGRTERPAQSIQSEEEFLAAAPTRAELLALFTRYARPDSYLDWLQTIKARAAEITDPVLQRQVLDARRAIRNIYQLTTRTKNATKPSPEEQTNSAPGVQPAI